jgi:Flp pilus assembly protein TadD
MRVPDHLSRGVNLPALRSLGAASALLLLAGCAGNGETPLRSGQPGLPVAQAALEGGTPGLALQICQSLLAQNPKDAEAAVCVGDALTSLGRGSEAGPSYERALALDAHSARALVGLGRLRLESDPANAEVLFTRALDREPRNAVALNDLGVARDLQGRHVQAQEAYGRALGISPTMQSATVNLALSMAMSGRAAEAVPMLRPLAENANATEKVRHDYAAVLTMAGRTADAEKILGADLSPSEVDSAVAGFSALPSSSQPPKAIQPASPPPAGSAGEPGQAWPNH